MKIKKEVYGVGLIFVFLIVLFISMSGTVLKEIFERELIWIRN